jgi:anti-anti-sigma factor
MSGFRVVRYGPNTYFLGGELDMAAAPALEEAVAPSSQAGGAVLLDLGMVTFIDSMGVHAIFAIADRLGTEGCILLHAAHPRVRRVLELVGVDAISNIHLDGGCPSDTLPNAFLDWRTPADIDREFDALRKLGQGP